ncbi:MAG TPA: amidase [Myxococcales bacterium]|nr:amidase [Myxococcales bacterium]
MTYDLKTTPAPRSAGWLLRLIVFLVEAPIIGRWLRQKLIRDLGFAVFHQADAAEADCLPDPLKSGPLSSGEVIAIDPLESLPRPKSWPGIADYARAYRTGQTTVLEVASAILHAAESQRQQRPPQPIFIAQQAEDIVAQATESAMRFTEGKPRSVLEGVPVAIKDELHQSGYPTTGGTSFMAEGVASSDATAVARLRAAGALLIGKTNLHEIGMGVTGINPIHGTPRNPYHSGHCVGGSSGGSAAAVASGLCPIAVGADGGGSIRIPAAFNGIVGLKPTFARISEHGVLPLCWSVGHVGPLGASVADVAIAYGVMAGPDPHYPPGCDQPLPHLDHLENGDLTGLKIGLFTPWFEDAHETVVACAREGVAHLEDAGAEIVEITIPELDLMRLCHFTTIASEMLAGQSRWWPHQRSAYGLDTRLNLNIAGELTAQDYVHAQRLRPRLNAHFHRAFETCDVIVTPTTGRTAPPIRPAALKRGESDLALLQAIMRYAQPANLSGLPALSVPCGYDANGLPVGLQIMGRAHEEALLLRMGLVVEANVDHQAPKDRMEILK